MLTWQGIIVIVIVGFAGIGLAYFLDRNVKRHERENR